MISQIFHYKIINNARIGAVEQDKLAQPTDKDHYFAIYESSPVNADRVWRRSYGNPWSKQIHCQLKAL